MVTRSGHRRASGALVLLSELGPSKRVCSLCDDSLELYFSLCALYFNKKIIPQIQVDLCLSPLGMAPKAGSINCLHLPAFLEAFWLPKSHSLILCLEQSGICLGWTFPERHAHKHLSHQTAGT